MKYLLLIALAMNMCYAKSIIPVSSAQYTVWMSDDERHITVLEKNSSKKVLKHTINRGSFSHAVTGNKDIVFYDYFDLDRYKDFAILKSFNNYEIYLYNDGNFTHSPLLSKIAQSGNRMPYDIDFKTDEIITTYESMGYIEKNHYHKEYGLPILTKTEVHDHWMAFDRVSISDRLSKDKTLQTQYFKAKEPIVTSYKMLLELKLEDNRTIVFYRDQMEPKKLYHAIFSDKGQLTSMPVSELSKTVLFCKEESTEVIFRSQKIGYDIYKSKDALRLSIVDEAGKAKKVSITMDAVKGSFEELCKKSDPDGNTRAYKIFENKKEMLAVGCANDGTVAIVDRLLMRSDGIWFGVEYDGGFMCDLLFSKDRNKFYLNTADAFIRVDHRSKIRESIVSFDDIGGLYGYEFDPDERWLLTWGVIDDGAGIKLTDLLYKTTRVIGKIEAEEIGKVKKVNFDKEMKHAVLYYNDGKSRKIVLPDTLLK